MPAFWKRVFLLPFLPSLWAEARHWPVMAIIGPLFVSATLWSGALAAYRGVELRRVLQETARTWDERFDPLVIEKGVARVEGDRLPEAGDEKTLMLADPEETRPVPADRRYMIIRKRTVIRGDGPPVDLKGVQEMIGQPVIRVDGTTLRAWVERWGTAVQLGMLAMLVVFEWIGTVFALLFGLVVGAVLMSAFGTSRQLTAPQCTRVGLATMAIKTVLSTALALAGTGVHACLGLLVWPALGVLLGSIALSRLPAHSGGPVAGA